MHRRRVVREREAAARNLNIRGADTMSLVTDASAGWIAIAEVRGKRWSCSGTAVVVGEFVGPRNLRDVDRPAARTETYTLPCRP